MATQKPLSKPSGFIDLQMHGDARQVDAMLTHLERRLAADNIAVFLASKVDPFIRMRAKERFADEGDSAVGGPWAGLKPATQAARSAAGYGAAHPINKRTGALEAYVTGAPHNINIDPLVGATLVMPGAAPTGELLKKFKTAQAGDNRTQARPVLAVDESDLGFVLGALVEHVTTGLL